MVVFFSRIFNFLNRVKLRRALQYNVTEGKTKRYFEIGNDDKTRAITRNTIFIFCLTDGDERIGHFRSARCIILVSKLSNQKQQSTMDSCCSSPIRSSTCQPLLSSFVVSTRTFNIQDTRIESRSCDFNFDSSDVI